MIALRKYSFFALAGGALFIGFYGWGPIDIRTAGRWDVRCALQPESTLAKEIAQCEKVLEEQVYEGEALGEVFFRLGFFHHQLDEWQIALPYYEKARQMRPDRVSAHYNSALILGRYMKDWEAVVDATSDVIDLLHVVDLVPPAKNDHKNAWIMRAYALLMLRQFDDAVSDIKAAQKLYPDKQELFDLLDHIDEIKRVLADPNYVTPDAPSVLDPEMMLRLFGRVFLHL